MKKAAVFLDRDGTINIDTHYVNSPDELVIFPAARRGLKLLQANGFLLFVVTNQSGLARGYFTREDLKAIHEKLERELGNEGISLEAISFCPHHPDENCGCRKPSPGMVDKIARKYDIDLNRSFFIGDKITDVETGKNAGCRTILLASPEEMIRLRREEDWQEPDFIAADLYRAALLITGSGRQKLSHRQNSAPKNF